MEYIKELSNNTLKELKFQHYSKILIILFISISLFSIWNLYSQKLTAEYNYKLYLQSVDKYANTDESLKEALNSPIDVQSLEGEDNTNGEIVSNIVRYDYESVASSVNNLKMERIGSITLEWLTFVFFPFFFGMFGIYIGTYDLKYKTIKIKAVQQNFFLLLFSKQLSMYLSAIIILSSSLLVSYVTGSIFLKMLSDRIPFSEFQLNIQTPDDNMFLQFLLSLSVAIIYSTLGFYLGLLFKGIIGPTILLISYNFILPVFGEYDLRNLIAVLAHKIFSFTGNFKLFEPKDVSTTLVFSLLFFIGTIFTIFIYKISEKRSKYVI
ncbi:hypothetical protein [Peribacillus frigoritolerans]|uniref:ABC-2 family transporter protein n=1 Tax=Peribacillus castrilensis TaxID=2897690 RepID=A0AAW9NA98_9BACI|nr:hypothetical protein [Peribacillus castrilensis]